MSYYIIDTISISYDPYIPTVETFPRGGRKIVAWRDFEVKDAKGRTFVGDEVSVETATSDGFTYHRVSAPDGKEHIVARTKG